MIRLPRSLAVWGSPAFADTLKQELVRGAGGQLPLQQALSAASYASDAPSDIMLIHADESADVIRVKVGVFYTGIIAGCSCADDPSPVEPVNEYCELMLCIDRHSGQTTAALLDDVATPSCPS